MITILYKPSNMSPSLVMMPEDTFDFQCVVNCDGNSKVVAATIVIIDDIGTVISIAVPDALDLYNGDTFTYTYDNTEDEPLVAGRTYRWYVRFYQTSSTSPDSTLINIPMSYGYLRNFEQAVDYHTLETLKSEYDANFLTQFAAPTETGLNAGTSAADNHLVVVPTSSGIQDGDTVKYWTRNGAAALGGLTIDTSYTVNLYSTGTGVLNLQLLSGASLVPVTGSYAAGVHYLTRLKRLPAPVIIRETLIDLKSALSELFNSATIPQQESIGRIIEKCNDLLGDIATDDNTSMWKAKYVDVSTMISALMVLYAGQHDDWDANKAVETRWYISQKDEFEKGTYILFNFSATHLSENSAYNISNMVGKHYQITGFNKDWFYIDIADNAGSLASLTSIVTLKENLAGARYTIFSTYVESATSFFKVISKPTLDITMPNDDYEPTVPSILQDEGVNRFYNFTTISVTGTYTQTEGVSWKGFYFELWKHIIAPASDILISTSETKYNRAIAATFTGLEKNITDIANVATTNEYYYLKLKIIDTNDDIISFPKDGDEHDDSKFVICYAASTAAVKPSLQYNATKSAAWLQWAPPTSGITAIDSWEIYKMKKTDGVWPSKFSFVASLKDNLLHATNKQFYDANVSSNGEYKYRIFPILRVDTALKSGAPYPDTDIVEMRNWDVDLFDIVPLSISDPNYTPDTYYVDSTNFWRFELDISFGAMVQNIDKAVYGSLSKYPKTSSGIKNYYTGDLSCYLSDVYALEQRLDTHEKQNRFREFVNNGKLKILKDRKGHVLLIDILSCAFTPNYELLALPIQLSISWVQIGDTSDMKIIYQ